MLWESWIASIAPVLSLTTAQAGVVLGLLFSVVIGLCGGLQAPDHITISMGIPTLLGLVLFTYAQWLPLFTGSALALVIALFVAKELSG
jgi:hypothetical protein